MVLEWATIPFRALVWHLEKQLLPIRLEQYLCNEMFTFKTRYRFYTSCFYLMNGLCYFMKSLSILMFSHIFILHNKTCSEADPTRIQTHPIRLKRPWFLAPAEITVQLHTAMQKGRQAGRLYGPHSHKRCRWHWASGCAAGPVWSLVPILGFYASGTQGCVFIEVLKLKPYPCNVNYREEKQNNCAPFLLFI